MCERNSVWMHRIDWTDDDGGGSTNDDDNNGASTLCRCSSPFAVLLSLEFGVKKKVQEAYANVAESN